MPRIIVKTAFIKSGKHREYYANYIATRDGAQKYKSDNGDKLATTKQKELIHQLLKDYPSSSSIFEYDDYTANPSRENASELITSIMDQNLYDVATKENYVDYISHRPRVEKLGNHGLFSDAGIEVNLDEVTKQIGEHQGNVWTHIISLKREDASRLGFDNVQSWMSLCQSKRNEMAHAMKISPEHLRWYAAFHNEGNHPHIHMMAYSTDPREGFVTEKGIGAIRRMYASEIFKNDLQHIYQNQTVSRDEIKKYSKEIVEKMLSGLNVAYIDNGYIFQKIMLLRKELEGYKGRLVYGYIPKQAKQIINDILREMEKDEHMIELYNQWCLYKQDIHQTYNSRLLDKLPLLEQKEFKSIKNMILSEVVKMNTHIFDSDELGGLEEESVQEQAIFDDNAHLLCYPDNKIKHDGKGSYLEWSDEYRKAIKLFYGSEDTVQDIDGAEDILTAELDKGNVLAMELLAKYYEVNNDKESASLCYSKALDGFHTVLENADNEFIVSYANYRLGKLYLYGKGTDVDYQQAISHFKNCSDNQYADYCLGTMYQRGLGVEQNNHSAFGYFESSAEKNNPFAQYETARYLEQGTIADKDTDRAMILYKYAYKTFETMISNRKDDNLLYKLGIMTYRGKGCVADYEKAVKYLEDAVALDNKNAKIQLAKIYLDENNFEKIPVALKWLEELDHHEAYYILGKEYHDGKHVEKDIAKAIHYLEKCEGNAYAYNRLSKIFEEEGIMNRTIDYLYKASSLDYDVAQVKLAKHLIDGEYIEKDIDKGIDYLLKAESKNNQFAQYMLGKLFLFGKEVEQDKERAVYYLTKASGQGNEYANYLLEHMNDYHNQPLALLTSRMFHHISKIFEQHMPLSHTNPLSGVDKKLRKKLLMKRSALGHKQDDSTLQIK